MAQKKPSKRRPRNPKGRKPPRGRRPRTHQKTRRNNENELLFSPRVNPKLRPVLEGIGTPEPSVFKADAFQLEAVEKLTQEDVVVSAPTGSGKTWIAEQAITRALESGQRAWYASPLKALSNAKLMEFGEIYGPERVGILTGDRKENPQADLIVGTTEILRNQLYDAMYRGEDLDSGLVVLDEAHFLGDPDRGVVWEEVIIYLPVRVRLLLLSATVENAKQIARWLSFVRGRDCATVISDQRPVPLYPLFLFPDGEVSPLKSPKGLFPKVRHHLESKKKDRHRGPQSFLPPIGPVMSALEQANLLPAIFFLKSRSDCDNALGMSAGAGLTIDIEARNALDKYVAEFTEQYPFIAGHPQLGALRKNHVAAHHAGHLPHWKLLVEKLMQKGLLKAIFSTSTVAAGVNFPARTVVVAQSDRFNGREFVDLKATDLLQMTGRAGRRGMDKIGFCLAVPGPFNDIPLLASLLDSSPEPIESQLHINFSMALNLLLSQKPSEIRQLLNQSLATFQRMERSGGNPAEGSRILIPLKDMLADSNCPGPEEAVVRRKRQRQLTRLIKKLTRESKETRHMGGLWGALSRGRVFMDMFGNLAAVLRREGRGESGGVLSVSLVEDRRLFRGRPKLEFVPIDEVAGVFQEVLQLPHTGGGRNLAGAVLRQIPDKPKPLTDEQLSELGKEEQARAKIRLEEIKEELECLPCADCPAAKKCLEGGGKLYTMLEKAGELLSRFKDESHSFWYDFVRHLEFLRSETFVDEHGSLTVDGEWASKLRLDHPVLIAEAIRQQALPEDDPVLLASLVALFVDDREREGEPPYLSQRLKNGIAGLQGVLRPMLARLGQWGFTTPVMPPQAAAAVFAWGLMAEFDDAVSIYGGAEGDLAQLIYRTADNLRQLRSLYETHPRLAETATEAVELMLRPPVVVPTI